MPLMNWNSLAFTETGNKSEKTEKLGGRKKASCNMRGTVFLALLGHVIGKYLIPPLYYRRWGVIMYSFYTLMAPFVPTPTQSLKGVNSIAKVIFTILLKPTYFPNLVY